MSTLNVSTLNFVQFRALLKCHSWYFFDFYDHRCNTLLTSPLPREHAVSLLLMEKGKLLHLNNQIWLYYFPVISLSFAICRSTEVKLLLIEVSLGMHQILGCEPVSCQQLQDWSFEEARELGSWCVFMLTHGYYLGCVTISRVLWISLLKNLKCRLHSLMRATYGNVCRYDVLNFAEFR